MIEPPPQKKKKKIYKSPWLLFPEQTKNKIDPGRHGAGQEINRTVIRSMGRQRFGPCFTKHLMKVLIFHRDLG